MDRQIGVAKLLPLLAELRLQLAVRFAETIRLLLRSIAVLRHRRAATLAGLQVLLGLVAETVVSTMKARREKNVRCRDS